MKKHKFESLTNVKFNTGLELCNTYLKNLHLYSLFLIQNVEDISCSLLYSYLTQEKERIVKDVKKHELFKKPFHETDIEAIDRMLSDIDTSVNCNVLSYVKDKFYKNQSDEFYKTYVEVEKSLKKDKITMIDVLKEIEKCQNKLKKIRIKK